MAKWRRGTTDEPPPAPKDTPELADRKYAGVPVPLSESLEQCSARMLPFLHDVLLRDVRVAVDARDAQEVSTAPSRPLTRTLSSAHPHPHPNPSPDPDPDPSPSPGKQRDARRGAHLRGGLE